MSKPARSSVPLNVTRGDPLVVSMALYNPGAGGVAYGAPVDLTGSSLSAQVSWSDESVDLDVSVVDGVLGKFKLTIGPETSSRLPTRGSSNVSIAEVKVVVTDSLGTPRRFVYPLEVWKP